MRTASSEGHSALWVTFQAFGYFHVSPFQGSQIPTGIPIALPLSHCTELQRSLNLSPCLGGGAKYYKVHKGACNKFNKCWLSDKFWRSSLVSQHQGPGLLPRSLNPSPCTRVSIALSPSSLPALQGQTLILLSWFPVICPENIFLPPLSHLPGFTPCSTQAGHSLTPAWTCNALHLNWPLPL